MTTSNTPAAMRGLDHVCVRVDDFERAIAWYREKLGFRAEKRWKIEHLPGVDSAYLRGESGLRMEITGGGEGGRHTIGRNIMEQFAIRSWNHVCFTSDDVDATMADLASRGVPAVLPPMDYMESGGARYAFVQDMQGNMIEFIGPLRGPVGIVS